MIGRLALINSKERPAPGMYPRILVAVVFLNKNILKNGSTSFKKCGSCGCSCGDQESVVLLVLLLLCCFSVLASLIPIHVKLNGYVAI